MRRGLQQMPRPSERVFLAATGKNAVVANALEAGRQRMQQKTADELLARNRQRRLRTRPLAAIVLVLEADGVSIEGGQSPVWRWQRDGYSSNSDPHQIDH